MADFRRKTGQALVEAALVLPCMILGIMVSLQLIVYCHNLLQLQRMAQVMADRQGYEHRNTVRDYWKFTSLWGKAVPGQVRVSASRALPWRPFRGVSTVKDSGWVVHVRTTASLFPGTFLGSRFGSLQQAASAGAYFEPALPREE